MSSATSLSSIPTISELYKQGELHHVPTDSTLYSASSTLNTKISLIRADITKLATTCIVNAANTWLLGGGGVDGAIHAAAGPGLYNECLPLNGCPTGSAKMTSAYDLPSKHIIHAVGPIYAKAKREGGENKPKELLEGCYRTSLDLAARLENLQGEEETSIAFSCLSTGVYGYPSNEAAAVASRCVRNWLEEQEQNERGGKIGRVVFCCFLEKDVRAYEEWLPKVFPPTDSELPSHHPAEEQQQEEEKVEEENNTTGNTQILASTSLASEPAPKKQKQSPTTSSQHLPPTNDEKEEWEAVEKPQTSLASSTTESTTTASEDDPPSESGPLGESAVNVDADTAAAAAREEMESKKAGNAASVPGGGGGLEDEGVEVEKPGGLEEDDDDDDDGVEVEKPRMASSMGKPENVLGKDW